MQKSKKRRDKKHKGEQDPSNARMHHVDITTETPTSRTGGGPMKEEKTTRAAGGSRQQDNSDKEDSMGSGKRQDDL